MFNFDHQFEIHDDLEVLRRMGMTYGLERGPLSTQDLGTVLDVMPTAVHRIITGLCQCEFSLHRTCVYHPHGDSVVRWHVYHWRSEVVCLPRAQRGGTVFSSICLCVCQRGNC